MGELRCSFCGKDQREVRKLIAGPAGVTICDECVVLCTELADEDEVPRDDPLPPVPRPRELHARLDEYIIGQDHAKKALAVAVYNHHKRGHQR